MWQAIIPIALNLLQKNNPNATNKINSARSILQLFHK